MELAAYGEITSVLVSRSGDLIVEDYREGDADTLRHTRSCTKTVVGMLLGIAIRIGLVADVGQTVGALLPDLSPHRYVDPRKRAITLEDLLTMRSCLECDDGNPLSAGNEERMYPQKDWAQFALDLPLRRDAEFRYCTAGVVLPGIALERAVGEPLPAFAGRELFEPIGIKCAEWPL